ncbi:hypothetical protein BDD43_3478 [Mucilaginibacter gracilis]|uniref:YceI-like domain-containing protein n=1 Tax=Mucilaginibacter gracilis TaxID=423350 RepID=A0A495J4K9_9SPHI|nr:hypothetical protein [Mucilaginibacter gracilis]RKR83274.1 hypothetical protein BDD43_3478 [Mucilaginibacter gracilis]
MKKKYSLIFLFCAAISTVSLFPSCRKVPGHDVTPSGSGSGTGTGTGTGTNTITFQFSGKTYTWSSPTYFVGLNSVPVMMSPKYSTEISFFDSGLTGSIILGYEDTVPGTYPIDSFFLTMTGVNLQQTGATKSFKATITSENIHVTNVVGNYAAGTVKGTFDGYVTDTNSAKSDSVRVTGSFNVAQ